jgi:hypothetical protein
MVRDGPSGPHNRNNGRPEEPEEGNAITTSSLRVTQDGSHLLPIGSRHPNCFTIPFLLQNDLQYFLLALHQENPEKT